MSRTLRCCVLATVAMLCAIALPSGVGAVEKPSDESTWTVEPISGTSMTFKRPAAWEKQSEEFREDVAKDAAEEFDYDVPVSSVLFVNPRNGDNIAVAAWPLEDSGGWFSNLREFKQYVQEQATGKVLGTGTKQIGGMPAYWGMEAYKDPDLGHLLFGTVEIRAADDTVVTVAISVSRSAHARRLVKSLIDSVAPA
jgi:hypothetical protein